MTARRILVLLTATLLLFAQFAVLAVTPAYAGETESETLQLLARSRKKNTPTPVPVETPTQQPLSMTPTPVPEGPIIDPQSIADYLFANGELPENFITKREARALGWESGKDLNKIAPGMSIGGDRFGNYESRLPVEQGVEYHEADCWYTGGKRNAFRLVYSNQGRVWYTEDHYETFTELFPTVPREENAEADSR